MVKQQTLHVSRSKAEAFVKTETAGLQAAISGTSDLILIVLRVHLLVENLLERIIGATLTRSDRLLDKANLTFWQKLCLVHSFDVAPDSVVQAIAHLNALRNKCSHERDKQIAISDLDVIGRPLGSEYTTIRRDTGGSPSATAAALFGYIFRELLVEVAALELDEPPPSDPAASTAT